MTTPGTAAASPAAALDHLRRGVEQALGADVVGVWQVGSFALGAADAASDVDFLVAVRRPPDAAQERALRALHARLPDLPDPWAQHLEGSYAPVQQLRRLVGASAPWLYVDNGDRELRRSAHDDTLATRWVAREHGIVLAGTSPRALIDPVAADELRADARTTLARWDADVRARPDQLGDLLAQQQHVLGLCRLLARTRQGRVVPKVAGAAWFLAQPGEQRWRPLVLAALDGRRLGWARSRHPTPDDVREATLALHRHVLELTTSGCRLPS